MNKIGGNTTAKIQIKIVEKNEIGEGVPTWMDALTIVGWLDLMSANKNTSYNAKLEESTHIFICDYVGIDESITEKRMKIGNRKYEIIDIDNPMQMNEHLEIYLKYIG